jgi:hypothetical protein
VAVAEGKLISGGDGSKYYWYTLRSSNVVKNLTDIDFTKPLKIAVQNNQEQPELNVAYTFYFDFYNPETPEAGLRVLHFRPAHE